MAAVETLVKTGQDSTMIKQGFISSPPLSLSPPDSTIPTSHPSPQNNTLFHMLTQEPQPHPNPPTHHPKKIRDHLGEKPNSGTADLELLISSNDAGFGAARIEVWSTSFGWGGGVAEELGIRVLEVGDLRSNGGGGEVVVENWRDGDIAGGEGGRDDGGNGWLGGILGGHLSVFFGQHDLVWNLRFEGR